jgi:hypothetical protein
LSLLSSIHAAHEDDDDDDDDDNNNNDLLFEFGVTIYKGPFVKNWQNWHNTNTWDTRQSSQFGAETNRALK